MSGPGSCGPVLVAGSRVPVARSRWPGAVPRPLFWLPGGPVPVPVCRLVLVARWPVPVPAPVCFDGGGPIRPGPGLGGPVPVARSRWPGPGGPVPVARVPVPIKRITYAVWPASMLPGMDAQSLPGIWLFYAVLQTTGERQTILRSRNHYRTKTGAKRLPKPTA